MIGFGMLTSALSLLGLWLLRGGRLPRSKWFYRVAIWTIPFPLIANSFGWIFTEMGRQPWVVYSQMLTRNGVSPLVGPGLVATSLIVLALLYMVLAVVEVGLLVRYAKAIRQRPRAPIGEDLEDRHARLPTFLTSREVAVPRRSSGSGWSRSCSPDTSSSGLRPGSACCCRLGRTRVGRRVDQ
jgi:cytochrome d ubiquinol oxidase subunit I